MLNDKIQQQFIGVFVGVFFIFIFLFSIKKCINTFFRGGKRTKMETKLQHLESRIDNLYNLILSNKKDP